MRTERKKICLINTGGTIGMMATSYGYAPVPGYMEKTLSEAEDFQHAPLPTYDFLEYDPLRCGTCASRATASWSLGRKNRTEASEAPIERS